MAAHRPRIFTRRTPDGHGKTFTLDPAALEMSSDVFADAAALAGTLGLVAELRGDIEREVLEVDAEYRNWFGRASDRVIAATPKLAWDKVKMKVQGDPEFLRFKMKIARLEGDAVFVRAFFDAAMAKSQMIRVIAGDYRGRAAAEAVPRDDTATPRPIARPINDREKLRERARQVMAAGKKE